MVTWKIKRIRFIWGTFTSRPPLAINDWGHSSHQAHAINIVVSVKPTNEQGVSGSRRLVHWLVPGGTQSGGIWHVRPCQTTCEAYYILTHKTENTQTVGVITRDKCALWCFAWQESKCEHTYRARNSCTVKGFVTDFTDSKNVISGLHGALRT